MPVEIGNISKADLSGGRNSVQANALRLAINEFRNDINVDVSEKTVAKKRLGQTYFNSNQAPADFISTFVNYENGEDDVLVHCADGCIYRVPSGSGAWVLVLSGLSTAITASDFEKVNDDIYFVANQPNSNKILKKDVDIAAKYRVRNLGIDIDYSWGNLSWGDDPWGGFLATPVTATTLGWGNFGWGNYSFGGTGVKGVQRYYVTFIRRENPSESFRLAPETESPPITHENVIDVGATASAIRVTVPVSTDPQCTGRRIYRKDMGENGKEYEGSYNIYLVSEIQNNTTTEMYDSMPLTSTIESEIILQAYAPTILLDQRLSDAQLATQGSNYQDSVSQEYIGTLGHVNIPNVSIVVKSPIDESIFYAGDPDYPGNVYMTKGGADTKFQKLIDPLAIYGIIKEGQDITAMARAGNDLIIATKLEVYRLPNFRRSIGNEVIKPECILNRIGIAGQRNIYEKEGRAGALFTDGTFRFLDELGVSRGYPVTPDLKAISAPEDATLVAHKNHWWLAHRITGSTNDKVLHLHKYQEEYSVRYAWWMWNNIWADFFDILRTTDTLISFSNKSGAKYAITQEYATQTDLGANIDWQIQTGNFTPDGYEGFLDIYKQKVYARFAESLLVQTYLDDNNAGLVLLENSGFGEFGWGEDFFIAPLERECDMQTDNSVGNTVSHLVSESSDSQVEYYGSSFKVNKIIIN